jgi:hypothetical protein
MSISEFKFNDSIASRTNYDIITQLSNQKNKSDIEHVKAKYLNKINNYNLLIEIKDMLNNIVKSPYIVFNDVSVLTKNMIEKNDKTRVLQPFNVTEICLIYDPQVREELKKIYKEIEEKKTEIEKKKKEIEEKKIGPVLD